MFKTAQRVAASRRGPAGGGGQRMPSLAGREIFDLRRAACRDRRRAAACAHVLAAAAAGRVDVEAMIRELRATQQ